MPRTDLLGAALGREAAMVADGMFGGAVGAAVMQNDVRDQRLGDGWAAPWWSGCARCPKALAARP